MTPLDLTSQPPRSPWEQLDGLYLLPRTIDKLRGQLPGGKAGTYLTHYGVTKVLLKLIRVDESALLEAVAQADSDADVAIWLRAHADPDRYEKANAILSNLTTADINAELAGPFEGFYADRPADLTNIFDILVWDDGRSFAPLP